VPCAVASWERTLGFCCQFYRFCGCGHASESGEPGTYKGGDVLTRSLARVETRVALGGAPGHEAACQRDARVDVVTGGGGRSVSHLARLHPTYILDYSSLY